MGQRNNRKNQGTGQVFVSLGQQLSRQVELAQLGFVRRGGGGGWGDLCGHDIGRSRHQRRRVRGLKVHIDVQRIFYKMEPRTLKAALKFYCEKEHEDAHDAMADVRATIDVFKGQLDKYENVEYLDEDGNRIETPIKNDVQVLHEFTNDNRFVDATQKLRSDVNGEIVFNFGKYINKPVGETLYEDRQYYNWILNKEFTSQVKQMVKKLVRDYEKGLKAKEKETGNQE